MPETEGFSSRKEMVTRDRIELKKDAFPGILSFGIIAALAES